MILSILYDFIGVFEFFITVLSTPFAAHHSTKTVHVSCKMFPATRTRSQQDLKAMAKTEHPYGLKIHQQSHSSQKGRTPTQHREFLTSWIRYEYPASLSFDSPCLLTPRSKLIQAHAMTTPFISIKSWTFT